MPSKKGIGGYSVVQRFVAWGFATSAAVLFLGWTGACSSKTGIGQPEADAQAVDTPVASGGAAGAASDAAAAGSGGRSTGGIIRSGGVAASGGIASTGGTNVADGATPTDGPTGAGGATPTGGSAGAGGATPTDGPTGAGGATPTGGSAGAGGSKISTGGMGGIACTDCSPLDAGCTGDGCSRDAEIDVAQSSGDAPIGTEHPEAVSTLYDACILSCQNEWATAVHVDDAGPESCATASGASCSTYCYYQTSRRPNPIVLSCPEEFLAFYTCAASGTWTCVENSQGYYISQPPNGCSVPTSCSDGG